MTLLFNYFSSLYSNEWNSGIWLIQSVSQSQSTSGQSGLEQQDELLMSIFSCVGTSCWLTWCLPSKIMPERKTRRKLLKCLTFFGLQNTSMQEGWSYKRGTTGCQCFESPNSNFPYLVVCRKELATQCCPPSHHVASERRRPWLQYCPYLQLCLHL